MASRQRIEILKRVKEAIRQPCAWPGGYPQYIVMADGEALSIAAARSEFGLIARATLFSERRDCWRAEGVQVNWEDTQLYCAHTNEKIESAYGNDEHA
jgi:hypothetical protein